MIFVFGSNLAGRHGKGAARHAALKYGAESGVGEGRTGRAYAIPTKGRRLEILPLSSVDGAIRKFIRHARKHDDEKFLLTPVGTGLAGHSKRDIWSILASETLPPNVYLASTWVNES